MYICTQVNKKMKIVLNGMGKNTDNTERVGPGWL